MSCSRLNEFSSNRGWSQSHSPSLSYGSHVGTILQGRAGLSTSSIQSKEDSSQQIKAGWSSEKESLLYRKLVSSLANISWTGRKHTIWGKKVILSSSSAYFSACTITQQAFHLKWKLECSPFLVIGIFPFPSVLWLLFRRYIYLGRHNLNTNGGGSPLVKIENRTKSILN